MITDTRLQLPPPQTDSQSWPTPARSSSLSPSQCPSSASTENDEDPQAGQACLDDYLREEIFPLLASPPFGEIATSRISSRRPVFLFTEKETSTTVVGKLFKDNLITLDQAWNRAEREYYHLKLLQERFDMKDGPDRVVTPYGKNRRFSAIVVMQLAPGHMLDHYILEAVDNGRREQLMKRLGYLARFFATLHHNSQTDTPISPGQAQEYLGKITHSLSRGPLSTQERAKIEKYASLWWNGGGVLTEDKEVIVHGDATPTNFLLHRDEVIGIDVEKMCRADRCWDLGFMAAELKHHFLWRTGDDWAAEPFIGHFLERYSAACGNHGLFHGVTRRLPLYMALGLMRIARNTWLDPQYRVNLLREARRCLKYGLLSSTTTEL